MNNIRKFIDRYILIIIAIFSVPAIRYLFVNGYFGVSDDLHIGWLSIVTGKQIGRAHV